MHPQAIMVKFDSSKIVGTGKDKTPNPWFTFLGGAVSVHMHGGLVIIDNVSKEWEFITRESFPGSAVGGNLGTIIQLGSQYFGVVCLDDRARVLDFIETTFKLGYTAKSISVGEKDIHPGSIPTKA